MSDRTVALIRGAVSMEEAVVLGFGGWMARALGQTDPRPRGEQLRHRLFDELLRDAARELTAAFDDDHVPHAIARGVALLGACYAPGERAMVDVDCYVPVRVRDRAEAILGALGYVADADGGSPEGMDRGGTWTRPAGLPVTVDLHWGLARADRLITYGEYGALDGVWPATVVRDGVRVPDPAAHLALVLHHLVHHDLLHARGLVDALLLWEGLPAEAVPRLVVFAKRWRVYRVTAGLAGAAGGHQLPGGGALARRLAPDVAFRRTLGSDVAEAEAISVRRIRERLGLLDRRRDAARLLRDVVFPPQAYLAWRWPEATPLGAWWRHVRRQAGRVMFPA